MKKVTLWFPMYALCRKPKALIELLKACPPPPMGFLEVSSRWREQAIDDGASKHCGSGLRASGLRLC